MQILAGLKDTKPILLARSGAYDAEAAGSLSDAEAAGAWSAWKKAVTSHSPQSIIRLIAESEGASLQDCVRLTVYVSDLTRFAPMVEQAQAELWGGPPYPPRTMIEVRRLFDDDIVEIDSVFYAPAKH